MNYKQLTSFELYEQEINSGFLKWGPCHTTEFFKDEIRAFEKDNFAIIKKLINIISHVNEYTSSDASNKFNEEERSRYRESIAVACYDLGEFSCYYPNGRKYCFSSPALTGLALSSNGTERIRWDCWFLTPIPSSLGMLVSTVIQSLEMRWSPAVSWCWITGNIWILWAIEIPANKKLCEFFLLVFSKFLFCLKYNAKRKMLQKVKRNPYF